MRKKRKQLPVLKNITITGNVSMGRCITRHEGRAIFVEGAVPGDTGDVQITRDKKSYAEGKLINLKEPSALRIKAPCIHFGVCGGCKWQHLDYSAQLKFKEGEVRDALERIGGFIDLPLRSIIASDEKFRYRNKLDFAFSDSQWLTTEEIASSEPFSRNAIGFHPTNHFNKVIDIYECLLQPEPSNQIRNRVRQFAIDNDLSFYNVREHHGLLRNLIIRNTLQGEFMIIMVFGEDDSEKMNLVERFLLEEFPTATTILSAVNLKKNDSIYDLDFTTLKGNGFITEKMEDLSFRISPKSFYQTNPAQAYILYKVVREMAGLTGSELVYDLYTGTGTIASFIGKQAGAVVGVEFVEEAVEDARQNAILNGQHNLQFEAGDMRKMLDDDFISRYGRPDVIITDPPRAGMHEDVVKQICAILPKRVVYVSCNPASQARDLALMKDHFTLVASQPVDMFPHTYHVENVVVMERRGE